MGGKRGGRVPEGLRRAAERFAQWRRTREVGMRIPEPLWRLACRLATAHGVSRTALELGLDYYALKKRVDASSSSAATSAHASFSPALPSPRASEKPAFVELPAATLAWPGECVLEFENAAGCKLRVHLKGGMVPDLVGLGHGLWNAEL